MNDIIRFLKGNLKTLVLNLKLARQERKYSESGLRLRYVFKGQRNSDRLVVVFSAFAGHEVKARYNYMTTLKIIKDNQLYILDDFGYHNVGSYYLGNQCQIYETDIVTHLINTIKEKCAAKDIIYVGSSKGGSSAMIYGLKNNVEHILVGSPQYHIGWYLSENDYHKKILDSIIGGTHYSVDWLDGLIRNNVVEKNKNTTQHLMFCKARVHVNVMSFI